MELKNILEAILFAAVKPLSAQELAQIVRKGSGGDEASPRFAFAKVKAEEVEEALKTLAGEWSGRPILIQEIAGGYRLGTAPDFAVWVGEHSPEVKPAKLSHPALETLAVIAYRQPISRAEIEAVRGVAVGGVLETLVERGVVRVAGRAEVPGRPLIYETTESFLEHFGLRDLRELPNVEELRRAKLPVPPAPPDENQPELIQENGETKAPEAEAAETGTAVTEETEATETPEPAETESAEVEETEETEETPAQEIDGAVDEPLNEEPLQDESDAAPVKD